MTISSEVRKSPVYACDGQTTSFPFAFKVFKGGDIEVIVADTLGVEHVATSYTVTLNSEQDQHPGGTVQMSVAPAMGYKLVVTSDIANLQGEKIPNLSDFYPEVVNNALDKLTILVQQVAEEADRSVKVQITGDITSEQLVDELFEAANQTHQDAQSAAQSRDAARQSEINAARSEQSASDDAAAAHADRLQADQDAQTASDAAQSASDDADAAHADRVQADVSEALATSAANDVRARYFAPSTTPPTGAFEGAMWYDLVSHQFKVFNGATWEAVSSPSDLPIGAVIQTQSATPPTGYAFLDGGYISVSAYPDAVAYIQQLSNYVPTIAQWTADKYALDAANNRIRLPDWRGRIATAAANTGTPWTSSASVSAGGAIGSLKASTFIHRTPGRYTWTVPANTLFLDFKALSFGGAGGKGSDSTGTIGNSAGGGGGGAQNYAIGSLASGTFGSTIDFEIAPGDDGGAIIYLTNATIKLGNGQKGGDASGLTPGVGGASGVRTLTGNTAGIIISSLAGTKGSNGTLGTTFNSVKTGGGGGDGGVHTAACVRAAGGGGGGVEALSGVAIAGGAGGIGGTNAGYGNGVTPPFGGSSIKIGGAGGEVGNNAAYIEVRAYSFVPVGDAPSFAENYIVKILASTVQTALAAHIADHGNPHGVTAAQVDAYTRSETNQAIATALAGAGIGAGNRGSVLNAFTSQGNVYSLTSVSASSPGTGYHLEDPIYFTDASGIIDAVAVVHSVDGAGGITALTVATPGAFSADPTSTYAVSTPLGGSGAVFAPTFTSGAATTLLSITDPHAGDYAYVAQDETHAGAAWRWDMVDQNGDGIYNWFPTAPIGGNGGGGGGDAAALVAAHNTSGSSHTDIRSAIAALPTNATLNSVVGAHNTATDAHQDIRGTANVALSTAQNAATPLSVSTAVTNHNADSGAHSALLAGKVDKAVAGTGAVLAEALTVAVSDVAVHLHVATGNVNTNAQTDVIVPLPVASGTQAGVMQAADKNALTDHEQRIAALEGTGSTYFVTIPATPSQSQLQALYQTASGNTGAAPDLTKLKDASSGVEYTWSTTANEWLLTTAPSIGLATDDSPGLFKGSTSQGEVGMNIDGTGSVVGWDETQAAIETAQSAATAAQGTAAQALENAATAQSTANAKLTQAQVDARISYRIIVTNADPGIGATGYTPGALVAVVP